jgi:uncharacterized RDD family membrane protein YckC
VSKARSARAPASPASGQAEADSGQATADSGPGPEQEAYYAPGQRFGLPEDGPGSVAGFGRRLLALIVDWVACEVIALAVFRTHSQVQLWTLVLFAAEIWLLTGLTGYSLGKRLLGIRVARLDGKPVGLISSLIRTVLLLLIVPPLALDKDLRGLHDKAAGTIVIRS